jgi:hypothetical protein
MADRLTRIPPGSRLRAPGSSSHDWYEPAAAGGLALLVWAAISVAVIVAGSLLP